MVQKISLSKGSILTRSNITNILNSARSSYHYARFDLSNNQYLTIIYNRDNTIEIATNCRDISLLNQIYALRRSYTQSRVIDFVFNYINRVNR